LAEGHPQAIKLAFGNTFLSESQVLKVLAKPDVPEQVVAAIAQHSRWSCQYNVRLALVRNAHTLASLVLTMLPDLTLRDLKELAKFEHLPSTFKEYFEKQLERRATSAED